MKIFILCIGVLAPFIFAFSIAGCGSSTCTTNAVSVNTLDQTRGAAIDTRFDYTFANAVNTGTVTTTDFFIRLSPTQNFSAQSGQEGAAAKADFDNTICDVAQALEASISCSRSTHCSLTPASSLEYDTYYVICLSGNIAYDSGGAFEGFMATFITASE